MKRSRLSRSQVRFFAPRFKRSDIEAVRFKGVLLGLRVKKTGKWLIWSYGDDVRFQEFTPAQVMKDSALYDAIAEAEDEGYNLSAGEMFKRLKSHGVI